MRGVGGVSLGDSRSPPGHSPDEQSEQVCQPAGGNQESPAELSACSRPVHYPPL